MRDVISTNDGPKAIGPYSQAIRANGFVFVSGQVALDPVTNTLVTGDIAFQTDRVLKNLNGILKASGTGLEKVVKATVFLKNMANTSKLNKEERKKAKRAVRKKIKAEKPKKPRDHARGSKKRKVKKLVRGQSKR